MSEFTVLPPPDRSVEDLLRGIEMQAETANLIALLEYLDGDEERKPYLEIVKRRLSLRSSHYGNATKYVLRDVRENAGLLVSTPAEVS